MFKKNSPPSINIKNKKPDIRHLKEMKEVVYDKNWFKKTDKDLELYYMYRGLKNKNNIRYDITIISPKILGVEFVKTKGHKHLKCEELYTVLQGEAIFLLQKNKGKIVKDVYTVKVQKNEFILIPPKYNHVTINPGPKKLKLGNWISEESKHDYEDLKKMNGACYFYIKSSSKKSKGRWIKNKNYTQIPKLRFIRANKKLPLNSPYYI